MIEIRKPYRKHNTEALHERLKVIFGERYLSMDSSDDGFVFRFETLQANDETTLNSELQAHRADLRTRRQEKAADRENAQRRLYALDIDDLRSKVGQAGQRDDLLLDILNVLEDMQKVLYEGR